MAVHAHLERDLPLPPFDNDMATVQTESFGHCVDRDGSTV